MLRVTMPAPGSTSTRSSPTGIKKISAADSARAATAFAVTTDSDRVASLVVPMPATMSPDVSPGSHRRRCSSVPASAITADAATVGRTGRRWRRGQLLEHDRQLGQSIPLATELRIDVQAEPSCGDDLLPQAVVWPPAALRLGSSRMRRAPAVPERPATIAFASASARWSSVIAKGIGSTPFSSGPSPGGAELFAVCHRLPTSLRTSALPRRDPELQAGHEAGLVGGQETHGIRDVRWFDVWRGHRLHGGERRQCIIACGSLEVRAELPVHWLAVEHRGVDVRG